MRGLLDLERVLYQRPERIDCYIFLKVMAFFVLAFLRSYAAEEGIKATEKEIQLNCKWFLGYTKDENKRLVIVPEEAEIVNPYSYLQYLFEKLPNIDIENQSTIDELLPCSNALPSERRIQK
jgi:hypothetical protein